MKSIRRLVLSFVLGFLPLVVVGASATPPGNEEAAVLAALHAGCRAYQNGDVAAVARFLAEGYTLTDSQGNVTSREEDLAEVRAGKAKYSRFENRDMKVRFYGDTTAVVTGRTHIEGVMEGRAISAVFQFTDTMIKRDGRWLIAASHASRIAAK